MSMARKHVIRQMAMVTAGNAVKDAFRALPLNDLEWYKPTLIYHQHEYIAAGATLVWRNAEFRRYVIKWAACVLGMFDRINPIVDVEGIELIVDWDADTRSSRLNAIIQLRLKEDYDV